MVGDVGREGWGMARHREEMDSTRQLCFCREGWLHKGPGKWKREVGERQTDRQ